MSCERAYVIVGGSGAIGRATARRLARPGVAITLAGRDPGRLEEAAEEVRARGGEAHTQTLDATRTAEVEACLESAAARDGRQDGVACFVGSIVLKPAHLTTDEEFERTLRLNLWPALACVRGAAKTMRVGGGSVLLAGTAASRTGIANHEAIAAAKGGVMGLALAAAATYAPMNIRVNVLAPGLVRSAMSAGLFASETSAKASAAMHALGRTGEAEDVGPLAAWLLGDEAAWVTGQVFGVDGGLGTLRPRVKA
jgi:NAD(P)-dependent dehydrogenase (short-subunit alcohol dehydrogenase family)